MTSKKAAFGICVSAMLFAVCFAGIFATNWEDQTDNAGNSLTDDMESIPYTAGEDGTLDENSLNFALFEQYGPVLLFLAICMFGGMIGAVCIARENRGSNEEVEQ